MLFPRHCGKAIKAVYNRKYQMYAIMPAKAEKCILLLESDRIESNIVVAYIKASIAVYQKHYQNNP